MMIVPIGGGAPHGQGPGHERVQPTAAVGAASQRPADEPHDGDADDDDEPVWKALASGLRRRMLDELSGGPLRTGDLADRFDVSRHVVMQHLAVLRSADLVRTVRRGRTRINYLNPVPIQHIHQRWVSRYEGMWSEALLGLKSTLEQPPGELPDGGDEQEGERVG